MTAEEALAAREAETRVRFGEQAERPPVFRHVPRGAAAAASATKTNKKDQGGGGRSKNNNKKARATMSGEQIEAEQAAMEALRRKAQAQYALVKARRKQAGDFHL